MNKVYAFSDIHGMYDLWRQISEYCDETDKIYFLGDAVDRGPDGIKIIEELLADKRIIYLKGNHEDFFIKIGTEILEGHTSSIRLWRENGGASTIAGLLEKKENEVWDLIYKLNALPQVCEYINKQGQKIILSHAGDVLTYRKEYDSHGGSNYLWDRDHLTWDFEKDITDDMPYIVHGHTPVPALPHFGIYPESYFKIYKYCKEHKIDIDLGCFETQRIALLDLDTLEPIYFTQKEE